MTSAKDWGRAAATLRAIGKDDHPDAESDPVGALCQVSRDLATVVYGRLGPSALRESTFERYSEPAPHVRTARDDEDVVDATALAIGSAAVYDEEEPEACPMPKGWEDGIRGYGDRSASSLRTAVDTFVPVVVILVVGSLFAWGVWALIT